VQWAAFRFGAKGSAAHCTIVGIEGGFQSSLGAQLAIGKDWEIVGSLADGYLGRELRAV
jgi:hypothetical protein